MKLEILGKCENANVQAALAKAENVLAHYKRIAVSLSGGADSDVMLDMIEKVKTDYNEVTYYFIDTGMEFQATKDHLDYIEERYNVKIERVKAKTPIPTAVKKKGVPFLSKFASDYIGRLQTNGFPFADMDFDEMATHYPHIKSAACWWNNKGTFNQFNINYYYGLKEWLISNPPDFPVASYCCEASKKQTAHSLEKSFDLVCVGVRKAEGGIRASAIKSCWIDTSTPNKFYPLFWLTNKDREDYEKAFDIVHSRCYTVWGFKRTGCVGCPFGRNVLEELEIIERYEPKMYKACMSVFGKSYEYTKKYRAFQAEMKAREKAGDQLMLTDL